MQKTRKTTKNTTTRFTRKTIAPGIEQLTPTTYRARASYNGVRHSLITTNKKLANTWINQVRTTGKTNVPKVK